MKWIVTSLEEGQSKIILEGKDDEFPDHTIVVEFILQHVTLDDVEQVGDEVDIFIARAPIGSYGRGRYEHNVHCMGTAWEHVMRLPDTKGRLDASKDENDRCSSRDRRCIHELTIGDWMHGNRIEDGEEIQLVIRKLGRHRASSGLVGSSPATDIVPQTRHNQLSPEGQTTTTPIEEEK